MYLDSRSGGKVPSHIESGWPPAGMEGPRLLKEERRRRIRALDGCLEQLETASELGMRHLSSELAQRLVALVPALSPGLATSQAIEFVFRAQEAALRIDESDLQALEDGGPGGPVSVRQHSATGL